MKTSHTPRIHRAETVRLHGSPGEAISLDDYIEETRLGITASDVLALAGFSARIEAKLALPEARQHRDLIESVGELMVVVESDRCRSVTDPVPADLAEAAVALNYLLKGVDLIPDSIPEIGLTDDARVVARVMARNPGLRAAA